MMASKQTDHKNVFADSYTKAIDLALCCNRELPNAGELIRSTIKMSCQIDHG